MYPGMSSKLRTSVLVIATLLVAGLGSTACLRFVRQAAACASLRGSCTGTGTTPTLVAEVRWINSSSWLTVTGRTTSLPSGETTFLMIGRVVRTRIDGWRRCCRCRTPPGKETDRDTGAVRVERVLGDAKVFLDGGNTNAVLADRSVLYGMNGGIIRIRPTPSG